MGNWTWEGLDKKGKRAIGKVEASSQREARKLLRAQGIRAKRIKAPSILEFDISEWMIEKGLAKPFGANHLTAFTKQQKPMNN